MKQYLFLFILLFGIYSVSATLIFENGQWVCYNDFNQLIGPALEFDNTICTGDNISFYACQGGGYACDTGRDDPTLGDILDLYCELENSYDFVECENGCNYQTGLCNEGYIECSNDYMGCCNDAEDCKKNIYRDEGDTFKCINNKWEFQEDCKIGCTEQSYNYAFCNFNKYYCTGAIDCYWSDTKFSNCYETPEECSSNLGFCCRDKDFFYTWRLGGCQDGENPSQGTVITEQYCESLNGNQSNCFLEKCEDAQEVIVDKVKGETCEKYFKGILLLPLKSLCNAFLDTGITKFFISEKEVCNSCFDKLGCKYTEGECSNTRPYCSSCWAWLYGNVKTDYCNQQDVFSFKLGQLVGWDAGPVLLTISQGTWCPIFLLIILVTVITVIYLIVLINKNLRKKRR